ncbi:MAG: hypothetical protein JW794_10665 [Candidatus Cloacimonetes bacterium]|nr:hypothetical protein [Candidatus Cloacimonadota bacterium]
MKRVFLFVISLVLFVPHSIFSFEVEQYNITNGKLQCDQVQDVFFYDTSQDNISDTWRTDATKSWYIEPSNPSDDFTSTLDENRWDSFGSPSINDTVYYSSSGLGYLQGLTSDSKWELQGDFDIQVSYYNCIFGQNGELRFEVKDADTSSIFSYISVKNINDTLRYVKNVNNVATTGSVVADSSGKIRLTRENSNISAYYAYWDAGSGVDQDRWKWSEIGSADVFNTNDVYVNIYTYSNTDTSVSVTVDNFITQDYDACTLGDVGSHTRGLTQAFPKQAILVATNYGLDIIDAEDNELWMRFKNYDGHRDIPREQNMVVDTVNCVTALDGRIYLGAYEGWMSGLCVIDFTSDSTWFYDNHIDNGTGWNCLTTISNRNMHCGWTDNNASYTLLKNYTVYDISAKEINDETYIAIANGIDPVEGKGVVVVLNIDADTTSYDIITSDRTVLGVDIGNNNKLYYYEHYRLFMNYSDYLGAGEFDFDYDEAISLSGGIEPSDIAVTNSYLYISDQNVLPNGTSGSTCKYDIDNLDYTGVKYTDGGLNPTIRLWGTASCSALETNDNALWLATHNSEKGRIYVIGAESPRADSVRGDFNIPYPLDSGYINSLSFGQTDDYAENLIIGSDSSGVMRLYSDENEISLENPTQGMIQHNFPETPGLRGKPFDFSYANVDIIIDPDDYAGAWEYGSVTVTLHNEDPQCLHPEHALDMWFELKCDDVFNAFPVIDTIRFTSPVPSGTVDLQLWCYSDVEMEWIPDSLDDDFTVTHWNFGSSPYSVSFSSNHFSSWALNNGGGGSIEYPPKMPENLTITIIGNDAQLFWSPVTENTFGDIITNVKYNIYKANTPFFSPQSLYYLDTVSDTLYIHENGSQQREVFYKVTAED